MKQQKGFTLIELIVVIVILGILAATALPKFIDVKDDAQAAAIQGVAGAVSSGFAVNYAGYLVNTTKGVSVSGATYNVSTAGPNVMAGSVMPAGYTLNAGAAVATVACTAAGQAIPVTVSNSTFNVASNKSAAATLICTG